MDAERLKERVVLVTGSSRGIGRATAVAAAREGARVAVTYNTNRSRAVEVAEAIGNAGGDCLCLAMDVSSRRTVTDAIGSILSKWGRLDVLVNNAGILEQKPFDDITDEDWDTTMAVNLRGSFTCSQESLRVFGKQKSGCIVNVSSVGGQMGGNKAPHYAASKAGMISMTKSLARIGAPLGVRVNAVAPGFIRTDIYDDIVSRSSEEEIAAKTLLGRIGTPQEVAAAVVYLASDEASYVTGHVLNVNGGLFLGSGS